MKVTCQSCGAQYNLPDDKIRGRKAKVKCKKCSERIVVDGTALLSFDDDDEATRVMQTASFTEGGDLLWTVNLSDDEQLDMTEPEVLAGWRDGTLTDDAYVWREGMDEWMPILEAPVLGDAIRAIDPTAGASSDETEPEPAAPIAAPVVTPAAAPEPSAPAAHEFTPITDVRSTPLPSAALGSRPSVPSPSDYPKPKSHRSEDTSKAFSFALGSKGGSAAKKPQSRVPAAPSSPGLFDRPAVTAPSAPAPGPAPEASENSVMFSLDALKAAAAVEAPKPRAAVIDEVRVNEDILTMGGPSRFDDNSMPLIDVEVPPAPPPDYTRMAAAAPILATPPKKNNGVWYAFAGAAVVALGVGAYFGLSDAPEDSDRTGVAATGPSDTAAGAAGSAPDEATASPTGETTTAPAASDTAPSDTAPPDEPAAPKAAADPSPNVAAVSPRPSPAPDPKDNKPSPAPAPAPAPKEPGKPFSISAAKSALSSAAASAKGCKAPAGPFGSGKVQVTFAPSGKVTSALIIAGPFGGTPVGSCVARTFRSASVPAFDGGAKTVAKSFSIK